MEQLHVTPFSHLTDEEFQRHLLSKAEPTAEDIEAALRFELLLGNYSALLEQVHQLAENGLYGEGSKYEALERIADLTAPARAPHVQSN
jgi:hypothetical protein